MDIRPLFAPDIDEDFLTTLNTLSVVNLSVEEAKKVYQDRISRNVRTVIAVVNGRVVGTATLLLERKFIHKGGMAGHIEDVAVHPTFQGQGIGKALIDHLVELARSRGCYKVVLDCQDQLQEFYSKCGFTRAQLQMRIDL